MAFLPSIFSSTDIYSMTRVKIFQNDPERKLLAGALQLQADSRKTQELPTVKAENP